MSQIVEAIYERGSFKLLGEPVEPLVEGQRVKLIIEPAIEPSEELLDLAAQVYEGLSDDAVDAVEKIALVGMPPLSTRIRNNNL
jgi:predicted DNA-binding antitoxin AbrB/MazE fold protein